MISSISGCPENPEPPCTCRMIGNHASIITCIDVNNEIELEKSMQSMRSSVVPIRTVEIFDSNLNYLPSKLFHGLRVPKLFLAGSSMVSLTDSDIAFVGLEDSLEILQVTECNLFAGWSWSPLQNLKALTEVRLTKTGPVDVDDDINYIADSNVENLFLTQNSITYLHDTAFAKFNKLNTLSLKMNAIKVLKRSMFPDPALQLDQLILSYTELEHLPNDIFSNMPKLRVISLAGNKILSLDQTTFTPVWNQLIKVDLRENPLRCDCRMTWLLTLKFPRNTWAQCDEPKQLKGKDLQKLTRNELWC